MKFHRHFPPLTEELRGGVGVNGYERLYLLGIVGFDASDRYELCVSSWMSTFAESTMS